MQYILVINNHREMNMPAKKTEIKKSFPKVIVYSTPTCHYCHSAKDFFKENNVPFEDIDVSKDQKAAEDMIEKSGQMGVPVIEIGGQIIVGFNKDAVKKALKL